MKKRVRINVYFIFLFLFHYKVWIHAKSRVDHVHATVSGESIKLLSSHLCLPQESYHDASINMQSL